MGPPKVRKSEDSHDKRPLPGSVEERDAAELKQLRQEQAQRERQRYVLFAEGRRGAKRVTQLLSHLLGFWSAYLCVLWLFLGACS